MGRHGGSIVAPAAFALAAPRKCRRGRAPDPAGGGDAAARGGAAVSAGTLAAPGAALGAARALRRRVRVALVTRGDLFPAHHGAAVKIVRTAESLAAQGDEVWVVSERRDHYWRVRAEGWEELPFGARFRAFQEWPGLRDRGRVGRLVRRLGYPEDETFLYRALVDPAFWARALYVGLRHDVEVWQAEFPAYVAPAKLAARGRPVWAVAHNVEFDRLRQMAGLSEGVLARLRRIEVGLLRAATGVVAVSALDRERLVAAGVPAERVAVVPHGVDLHRYEAAPLDLRVRYGLLGGPVLFFHGTLHYAPNADAVRFLAEELAPALPPSATLLIAGLSPPRHLETEVVRFTGPVDDLPAHILAADLCLCPLTAGGGTRMKLVEFFAAGKAVVSTPLGAEGLPVQDGVHLRLAELDQFVPRTLELLTAPDERRRLGRAARRLAQGLDWAEVGAHYRALHRGERADFAPRPRVDTHLPVGRRPSKPLTLLFLVNRGCNLRCRFCDLWEGRENVPVARALGLFDEAAAIGTRTAVLTGGEPLLHPGLYEIVAGAAARGLSVNVTTNGTLVERHWERLVRAPIQSLSMSVDGLPETHDRLRGRKGSFETTWRALERVVREGRFDPCVYFTVTRENVGELVAVWRMVRALGCRFDFWPVNDARDLYLSTPAEHEAWRAAVTTIAATEPDVAARAHYYAEAMGYHEGAEGPVRCLGLVDQYGVTYDGRLLPCCVWGGDGLSVGNVWERPLRELWHDPAVQSRREALYRSGCEVGCYNHSLYEFTASTGESHRLPRRSR